MKVSSFDIEVLQKIRLNVDEAIKSFAQKYDHGDALVLDVAPQDYDGAKKYFKKSSVKTLDIDSGSGADFVADLCKDNSNLIENDLFDLIICTEVLEHTLNPFCAAEELFRILKKDGLVLVTTPFDFRIHGPLPDCWRFTEHGLRSLFSSFKSVEIRALENEHRFLMPLQYVTILRK